jgi:hypothetical protein
MGRRAGRSGRALDEVALGIAALLGGISSGRKCGRCKRKDGYSQEDLHRIPPADVIPLLTG